MSAAGAGGKVAAVIVHYRTPAETTAGAAAVASTAPEAEIVVVDNASGDRVGQALAAATPAARLITQNVKRGYGPSRNRSARETNRPYLLFLNSDAIVRPGAIAALADALDRDAALAAAGPRLRNTDGSGQDSIRMLPTPWRIFCESAGLAFLSGGRAPLVTSFTALACASPRPDRNAGRCGLVPDGGRADWRRA